MVFSSLPLPNWQQQPNEQTYSNGAGMLSNNNTSDQMMRPGSMVDRARMANIPMAETALKCPRCDSSNTKFCYFNNYSLTQPRHFCKTCRRYWTRGGSLRNVPVGGGCRRSNKRSSSSSSKPKPNPNPSYFSGGGEMGLPYFAPNTDHLINIGGEQWRFPYLPAESSSGIIQQMASVKMEDNINNTNTSRQIAQLLAGTDQQYYFWNDNNNYLNNNTNNAP